jgi:hypothetical protein
VKRVVRLLLSISCAAVGLGCGKSNGNVSTSMSIDAGSEPPMRPGSPATWYDAGADRGNTCTDGACMGGTGMGGPCAGGTGMGGTCMGENSIDDEMFRTGPCEPADCAINGLPIEFENHGFAETFGCCLDEDDVTVGCGIMIEGGPCVPQPRQDSRCPWFTQGLNDERQSCCTESGLCGVDAWSLGRLRDGAFRAAQRILYRTRSGPLRWVRDPGIRGCRIRLSTPTTERAELPSCA